jgi:phosphoserine phosphatase
MPISHTVSATGSEFIDSVLRLSPRVAALDCDGTLWSSDAGETFLDWEIRTSLVSADVSRSMRARYAEYKAGRVSEVDMCGEMVAMHKGIPEATMMQAAEEFMGRIFPGKIFDEMLELIRRLRERGCEIWAVSSSNEWVIRAGIKPFGIPESHILATRTAVENGVVTDRLIQVPSGPGKVAALRRVVDGALDAAFGNSRWDIEMLAMARHAFAINPSPDLRAMARERGWTVYFPDGTRSR